MKFEQELLPGVIRVTLNAHKDIRGTFVKTFAKSVFLSQSISFDCSEEYYSVSAKNVVRGMHFQLPPHAHAKMVFCAAGAVQDVLLDLRKGPGYGRIAQTTLSAADPAVLLIPCGIAHGFLSLEDNTLMVYKTSTEYAPEADMGILWDSFGHHWNLPGKVIISDRDKNHISLDKFQSPF